MSNSPFRYTLTVTTHQAGRTIRSLLQHELKFSTRLQRNPEFRVRVQCNDRPAFLHERVKVGDVLSVPLPIEVATVTPERIPIDICYEDEQVLVVNKPAGMLTHPSAKERQGSLLAAVSAYLQPHQQVPHCVHRLDRETSGVVMFARHAHFHHLFDMGLREGKMHRSYCALVRPPRPRRVSLSVYTPYETTEKEPWHTINLPIGQDPQHPSQRVITDKGQRAVTHFLVLARTDTAWLVLVRLETGRTHQIRLHFSAAGMPLLGDPVYGDRQDTILWSEKNRILNSPFDSNLDPHEGGLVQQVGRYDKQSNRRQALHALRLSWQDPVTEIFQQAYAPVALDLRNLWELNGGDSDIWDNLENYLDD